MQTKYQLNVSKYFYIQRLRYTCYCCLVAKLWSTLVNPWTKARQAPLTIGFPWQEYWSGLPFLSPRDLSDPGVKPVSPAWQADSLPLSTREAQDIPVIIFLVAQLVKNLPAMRETKVWFLSWEDPLEKGKATHSSILAWRIPWTIPWGHKESNTTEWLSLLMYILFFTNASTQMTQRESNL